MHNNGIFLGSLETLGSLRKRGKTFNFPTCQTHYPQICELRCKECNIAICASCVFSDHENHQKEDILKYLTDKKELIEKDLSELNKSIYPDYQKCANDLIVQKNYVRNKSEESKTNLIKQGEALHAEIDTIIQGKKSDIEDKKAQCMTALDQQEDAINHTITEMKQVIEDLQDLLKTDNVKRVFEYTSKNEEFRNLSATIHQPLPTFTIQEINIREQISYPVDPVITFPARQPDDPTSTASEQSDPLKTGGLSSSPSAKPLIGDPAIPREERSSPMKVPDAMSSPPARPLIADPSIRKEEYGDPMKTSGVTSTTSGSTLIDYPRILTDIDTGYGKRPLTNVTCLSDNELWICHDNIMILYNLQGELLRFVQTKSKNGAWNIAVTQDKNLVYTDYGDRSVNLVRGTQIQKIIQLKGWAPLYLCISSSGDLLVVMMNDKNEKTRVVRYSGSTKTQRIQWDAQGKPLFTPRSSSKYLSENRNLDICVADNGAGAVVVVSAAGKLRFRYTGFPFTPRESFYPLGITTDSHGNILTCDSNSDRIHILDQDGHFLRYIDNCGLQRPWGLCLDSKDNLFVAEYHTGKVKKIQYYK